MNTMLFMLFIHNWRHCHLQEQQQCRKTKPWTSLIVSLGFIFRNHERYRDCWKQFFRSMNCLDASGSIFITYFWKSFIGRSFRVVDFLSKRLHIKCSWSKKFMFRDSQYVFIINGFSSVSMFCYENDSPERIKSVKCIRCIVKGDSLGGDFFEYEKKEN